MVATLLVDANLDGHARLLDARLQTKTWSELREYLDVRFLYFEQVGLARADPDVAVWRYCQEHSYYLLTANRNQDSEDSLEATLRRENAFESLPVFTFADPERIFHSRTYLDQVIERLLDYLLNVGSYRGAGRLFLP